MSSPDFYLFNSYGSYLMFDFETFTQKRKQIFWDQIFIGHNYTLIGNRSSIDQAFVHSKMTIEMQGTL